MTPLVFGSSHTKNPFYISVGQRQILQSDTQDLEDDVNDFFKSIWGGTCTKLTEESQCSAISYCKTGDDVIGLIGNSYFKSILMLFNVSLPRRRRVPVGVVVLCRCRSRAPPVAGWLRQLHLLSLLLPLPLLQQHSRLRLLLLQEVRLLPRQQGVEL